MALLVLLGAASLAEAQIVVSSTTASTVTIKEKEKSGREKGLAIRPEIGIGTGMLDLEMACFGTVAYQFNPIIAVGGGAGLEYGFDLSRTTLPIYANARVYFCDRKWSPFLDLNLLYSIPISQNSEFAAGFGWNGMIGVQFRKFDTGVMLHSSMGGGVMFCLAYNFQLKKR